MSGACLLRDHAESPTANVAPLSIPTEWVRV
jgi:hypothetical protein